MSLSSARPALLLLIVLVLVTARPHAAQQQAGDRARTIVALLAAEKFEEVSKQFTSGMATAMPPSELAQVWSTLRQQVGAFKSTLDDRADIPRPGITAVTVGCQFENAALNVIVVFDADNRIAGLRFASRAATSSLAPPASSHFTEQPVTVGVGEWMLPGTLSMPAGDRPVAAVVLVHGSGPADRDETIGPNTPFRDLAWGLAERGIAVLRYEKRTRQYASRLAGNQALTVHEETIEDAILAAALLRKQPRIDPKRVFLLGHSLGGTLAPRIANEDRALAGLIIMAGSTRPLLDVAREQLAYLKSIDPSTPDPDDGLARLRKSAPEAYWKDLDAYSPSRTAATLSIPMLILQGERDYQVTLADLEGWRQALRGQPQVTFKVYPALNHLFQTGEGKATPAEYGRAGHVATYVVDDIADWIRVH